MQNGKLDIAILADGNYPTAEYPLGLLLSADIVICCDASVLKLKGRTPDYIVGDMDTLPDEYKEKYKHQQLRKPQIQKSWTINVQTF